MIKFLPGVSFRRCQLLLLQPLLIAALCTVSLAQDDAVDAAPEKPTGSWTTTAQATALHQPEADLDTGGDVSLTRLGLGTGLRYGIDPRNGIGVNLGYTSNIYDFSNPAAFAGAHPWDTVDSYQLGLVYFWSPAPRWDVIVAPFVGADAESGAGLGDSITGGAVAAVSYSVYDNLTIGPGVGFATQLEDDTNIFPVLVFNWQINDRLSFGTRAEQNHGFGAGASLAWRATDAWTLGVGASQNTLRFRLDDDGLAPGGVGEDESNVVYLTAGYKDPSGVDVSLIGGAKLNGALSLEDTDGVSAGSSDYDTAGFFGISIKIGF